MDWKLFANWLKVALIVEMTVLFILFPDRPAMEIIMLGLGQYALFFPIDASIIIKNIKGQ